VDLLSIIACRMDKISTVFDLIAHWPRRQDLADDIGISLDRVHKWAKAGSIPAWYHAAIIRAARAREIGLTAEDMVAMHDRPIASGEAA
jgi:hypothetical protein